MAGFMGDMKVSGVTLAPRLIETLKSGAADQLEGGLKKTAPGDFGKDFIENLQGKHHSNVSNSDSSSSVNSLLGTPATKEITAAKSENSGVSNRVTY